MKNEIISWLDRQFDLQEQLSERIEFEGVICKNLSNYAPKDLQVSSNCLEQISKGLGVDLIWSNEQYPNPNTYEKYFMYKNKYRVFALFDKEEA